MKLFKYYVKICRENNDIWWQKIFVADQLTGRDTTISVCSTLWEHYLTKISPIIFITLLYKYISLAKNNSSKSCEFIYQLTSKKVLLKAPIDCRKVIKFLIRNIIDQTRNRPGGKNMHYDNLTNTRKFSLSVFYMYYFPCPYSWSSSILLFQALRIRHCNCTIFSAIPRKTVYSRKI